MIPDTSSRPRHRRGQWLRRAALILIPLLIAAVIWDGIRGSLQPAKRPDFTATTLQGKDWSLSNYRGKQPVIVSFFATWCSPCKQELPHLIKLRDKYRDRGVELVIITRESPEVVKQFPEFYQMPVTLITDGSAIFDEYQVDAIPHTILFDRSGKIVFDVAGFYEAGLADLEKKLAGPLGS